MIYNYHKVLNLIHQFRSTGEMPSPPNGAGNAYVVVEKRSVPSDASEFDEEVCGLWLCMTQREAIEYAHELGYTCQYREHPDTFYRHEGDNAGEMHLSISGIEAELSWEAGVLSAGLYAWMFGRTGGDPFLGSDCVKLLACELDDRHQSHSEPF